MCVGVCVLCTNDVRGFADSGALCVCITAKSLFNEHLSHVFLGSEWAGIENTLATPLQIASGVMDRYTLGRRQWCANPISLLLDWAPV